jgi:hypothetical protein
LPKEKAQTMINKILHRKQKIEKHEPTKKKFEDTIGVSRSRKLKKDRQHND